MAVFCAVVNEGRSRMSVVIAVDVAGAGEVERGVETDARPACPGVQRLASSLRISSCAAGMSGDVRRDARSCAFRHRAAGRHRKADRARWIPGVSSTAWRASRSIGSRRRDELDGRSSRSRMASTFAGSLERRAATTTLANFRASSCRRPRRSSAARRRRHRCWDPRRSGATRSASDLLDSLARMAARRASGGAASSLARISASSDWSERAVGFDDRADHGVVGKQHGLEFGQGFRGTDARRSP